MRKYSFRDREKKVIGIVQKYQKTKKQLSPVAEETQFFFKGDISEGGEEHTSFP